MNAKSTVAIIPLIIVTAVVLSCKNQGGEREMTTEKLDPVLGRFELLFVEAVTEEGDRYRELRAAILNLDVEQIASLRGKLDHPDWHISLQAEILTGWLEESERYEFIRRVAYGTEPSLEPDKYLTGKPTVGLSAEVIAQLGSRYAPALLELVYKERDAITQYAYHVCNRVLIEWKEPRAIPVYRELLLNSTIPADYRDQCIMPLVSLEAENLFEDLVSVYNDKEGDPELRAAALATLGYLDDDRTIPLLEKTLRDRSHDSNLRYAAAKGLGKTRKANAISVLTEQYRSTDDSDLKTEIIFALGALDIREAIQPLKSIRETEQDNRLQELIDKKLLDLEYLDK